MKKLLATLLAASTVLCMAPALAVSAAETTTVDGLSMESYQMVAPTAAWEPAYTNIIGSDGRGAYCGYNQMKKFDQSIDDLLYWSYKTSKEPVKTTNFDISGESFAKDSLGFPNGHNYMVNWTGTMTAATDITLTVVASKIDNGFVFEVDGTRYFEYWGAAHWFDGANDRLASEKSLTLEAGKSYNVNIWYLELDGGDALAVGAYAGESTEYKSFADLGVTFDLAATGYHTNCDRWGSSDASNHPYVDAFRNNAVSLKGTGDKGEKSGGNGAQILNTNGEYIEENRQYDNTFEALMAASKQAGGTMITESINPWAPLVNDESYINVYNGYVTVENTGYYLFGAANVDNGLVMEIDGTRVFEFWCNGTWQDNGVDTWDKVVIKLEAGKTYPFYAAFLEMDGGQVVDPIVKFAAAEADVAAATAVNIDEVFTYTTDVPTNTDLLTPAFSATVVEKGTKLNDKIDSATIACNKTNGFFGDGALGNMFDGKYDTKMGRNTTEAVSITWQTTEATTVTHYAITAAIDGEEHRRTPAMWTLLGSTDGVNYTVIDHVSWGMGGLGCVSGMTGMYQVDEPAAYSYYRLDLNCATHLWGGGSTSIAELEIYNCAETAPNPPATNPPETNPPATNPPATNPPATNPPSTNPPENDDPTTPPVTDAPTVDSGISDDSTADFDPDKDTDNNDLIMIIAISAIVVAAGAAIAFVLFKKKKS